MFPSRTSSIDGCSAAVTETESPSQLSPAVNQRMCTSLTPDGADLESEAMPSTPLDQYFFDALPLQIYRHKKYGNSALIPVEKCHSVAMSGLTVATYGAAAVRVTTETQRTNYAAYLTASACFNSRP